jgi:16S rRNA U516 pseudouridylate synthase RsuA-like enzyme
MVMKENNNKIVLQKFIADSGFCSRRKAEELIRDGKVKVNGELAELGARVFVNDEVEVSGKLIENNTEKIYIIINKPEGYVCTNRSFKGEKNIFDLLVDGKEKLKQRLFVVGRLDKNSRGLVLLTNDGELTQRITHPSFQHEKEYEVEISPLERGVPGNPGEGCDNNKKISKQLINDLILKFKKGVKIENKIAKAKEVIYLGNNKFKIILTQGIKRQIRLMFKEFGLEVEDLKRVRIDCGGCGINLGNLKCGEWRKLKISEIEKLHD